MCVLVLWLAHTRKRSTTLMTRLPIGIIAYSGDILNWYCGVAGWIMFEVVGEISKEWRRQREVRVKMK